MKCKKCNTNNFFSKKCKKCNEPLNNRKILYFGAGFFVIFLIFILYTFNSDENENIKVPLNPIKSEGDSETTTDSKELEEIIKNNVSEAVPKLEENTEKTQQKIDLILDNVLTSINEYYNYYSDYTSFVTKNGFLYDFQIKSYVNLDSLVGTTNLNPEYSEENITFLYVKPSDVEEIIGEKLSTKQSLEVFVAYKTSKNVMLVSNDIKKTIESTDFDKLIQKYKTESSIAGKIMSFDDGYNEVLESLKKSENISDFDIRTMMQDKKYTMVVFSPKDKANQVNQFILEKVNDVWEVKIKNIEQFFKPIIEVNKILVDFNLGLMPKYNLNEYKEYMDRDFSGVIKNMRDSNLVLAEDGEAVFISGTNSFVYIEFESNKKFIGNYTEQSVWVMYPVQNYQEAAIMMITIDSEKPPLFILKQDS